MRARLLYKDLGQDAQARMKRRWKNRYLSAQASAVIGWVGTRLVGSAHQGTNDTGGWLPPTTTLPPVQRPFASTHSLYIRLADFLCRWFDTFDTSAAKSTHTRTVLHSQSQFRTKSPVVIHMRTFATTISPRCTNDPRTCTLLPLKLQVA